VTQLKTRTNLVLIIKFHIQNVCLYSTGIFLILLAWEVIEDFEQSSAALHVTWHRRYAGRTDMRYAYRVSGRKVGKKDIRGRRR
jgi:hypothetical protein